MLTDPQASREGGVPYDLLAGVGIGPSSSMKEILDASFLLMEQGRWSPEVRRAWDELRTIERRLAVDFLLYDVEVGTETAHARPAALAALLRQSRTDLAALYGLDWEFHEIMLDALDTPDIAAFDQPPPLPGPDVVEFDR